ncbi:MAG: hypothetical protein KGL39_56045 [Patescibacteria group bacterium]|nr:hypothetical protein [Patescibacteria group bacterium]
MMKTAIPATAKKIPLRPLALGEKTGHHHSLMADPGVCLEDAAELFEIVDESGTTAYLRISADGVRLVHQEHKAHLIAPGEYRVTIQKENTDWGARPVVD